MDRSTVTVSFWEPSRGQWCPVTGRRGEKLKNFAERDFPQRKYFEPLRKGGYQELSPDKKVRNDIHVYVDVVLVTVHLQVQKHSVSFTEYVSNQPKQSRPFLLGRIEEELFSMQPPVVAKIELPKKVRSEIRLPLTGMPVNKVFLMPNGEEVNVDCFGNWDQIPKETKCQFVRHHMRDKLIPSGGKLEISVEERDGNVKAIASGWEMMKVSVEGINETGRFLKNTKGEQGLGNIKKWVDKNRIFWPPGEAELQIVPHGTYTLIFTNGRTVKFKQDNHEIVVYVSHKATEGEDLKKALGYRMNRDVTALTLETVGRDTYSVKEASQKVWFSYDGTVQSLDVEPGQTWEQVQHNALESYGLDPNQFQCCPDAEASDGIPMSSKTNPVMIVHSPVEVKIIIKNEAADENTITLSQITVHDTVRDIKKKIREQGICKLPIIRLVDGPVIPEDTTMEQIQKALNTNTVELLLETEVDEVRVTLLIGEKTEERTFPVSGTKPITIGDLRTQLAEEKNQRNRETISILYAGKCLADELEIGHLLLTGKKKLVVFMQSQEPLMLQSVKAVKCCFSYHQHEYTLALPLWLTIADAKKRLAEELQKENIVLKSTNMEFVFGDETLNDESAIGELGLTKRQKIVVTRITDPRESWRDCITPEEVTQVREVQIARSYLANRSEEELLKLYFEVDRNLDIFKLRAEKRWDPRRLD